MCQKGQPSCSEPTSGDTTPGCISSALASSSSIARQGVLEGVMMRREVQRNAGVKVTDGRVCDLWVTGELV